jgi:Spy/CpxP family protein refolding chaperone
MTRTSLWVLVVVLLLSVPRGAWANAEEDDPFQGRLLPVELVMAFRREIDLTREQSAAIGELVVELQEAVAKPQWQMQSTYFDLLESLDEPRVDEQRVMTLAEQALIQENVIKLAQIRLLVRVRNLLTPDQVAFLQARVAEGWQAD